MYNISLSTLGPRGCGPDLHHQRGLLQCGQGDGQGETVDIYVDIYNIYIIYNIYNIQVSLVRALDREEVSDIQVVVTVQDDNPANIVAVSRRIRGEYSAWSREK